MITYDLKRERGKISGTIEICCHRVEWFYNIGTMPITGELIEDLVEEAEDRSKTCIAEGYCSGELCCSYVSTRKEHEFFGGWKIVN